MDWLPLRDGALTSIKSGAHPSVKQPLYSSSTPDDRVSYLLAVTETLPANSAVANHAAVGNQDGKRGEEGDGGGAKQQ